MPPIQIQNRRHKDTMNKGHFPLGTQSIKANPILKTPLKGMTNKCRMTANKSPSIGSLSKIGLVLHVIGSPFRFFTKAIIRYSVCFVND